ncbi:MAG TPA: hypothetical protein VMV68_01175, partial [Spirochaetia bacterium]|nr:hypothetical protein [Spirochaetia bacterium]
MRKHLFLIAALVAVVSLTAYAGGSSEKGAAQPAKPTVLRISNGINQDHPTYLACKRFAELLQQKDPGK